MQRNEQEQARVESALETSAQTLAARFVVMRLNRERQDSPVRVLHRTVEGVLCIAIALAMTTAAIYAFTQWMGW